MNTGTCYIVYLLVVLALPLSMSGQAHHEQVLSCATDHVEQQLATSIPDYRRRQALLDRAWKQYQESGMTLSGYRAPRESTLTLPVVVHIIHDDGPENISDSRVLTAIDRLNDAFRNRGYYNPATGVDTRIQFCLARRTPDGQPTNGILRHRSALTDMSTHYSNQLLAALGRYDPEQYINIRVVKNVCYGNDCSAAGYAVSGLTTSAVDGRGIVIEARYMGAESGYDVVSVHEMGHFLGLRHTFYGGCQNDDCLLDGDRICDTPPDQQTGTLYCDYVQNSCTTDEDDTSDYNPYRSVALGGLGDQVDQHRNYMDYSGYSCYDRFTEGQKARMHFIIENQLQSLVTSPACLPPCPVTYTAGFTASADSVPVGTSITFTNTSDPVPDYAWYLDGQPMATTIDYNHDFDEEGIYTIRLEIWNGDSSCAVQSITHRVTVYCPIIPRIDHLMSGDQLYYTDVSTGGDQTRWMVRSGTGDTLYQSTVINDSFPTSGLDYVQLCLTVSNTYCRRSICRDIRLVPPGTEICDNELDDDGDGLVDLFDSDCPCDSTAWQAQCPLPCQYQPDTSAPIALRVKWRSAPIGDLQVSSFLTGDINQDSRIEVVTRRAIYNASSDTYDNFINILNGQNGGTMRKFEVNRNFTFNMNNQILSACDTDDDGQIELFVPNFYDSSLTCFDIYGQELWTNIDFNRRSAGRLNFVDFNYDGREEIVAGNHVYNATTGTLLLHDTIPKGCNNPGYEQLIQPDEICLQFHSVVADFLGTEELAIAAGNTLYRVELTNNDNEAGNRFIKTVADTPVTDGYTAMGDIDGDGFLDVISVRSKHFDSGGGIWVWNPRTGALIAHYPAEYSGEVPTIGDIDGDCDSEILIKFKEHTVVLDYQNSPNLQLLYLLPFEDNSASNGISLFDLDGDGAMEIIYNDTEKVHIADGRTGQILADFPLKNHTSLERPVIADVDLDGQADILVSGYVDDRDSFRIYCLESAGAPWAPARSVWNQYGYHITNVNDDLSIPRQMQNGAVPLDGDGSCCPNPYNSYSAQASYYTQDGCLYWPMDDWSVTGGLSCRTDSLEICIRMMSTLHRRPNKVALQVYRLPAMAGDTAVYSYRTSDDSFCLTLPWPDQADSVLISVNDAVGIWPIRYDTFHLPECDLSNNTLRLALPDSTIPVDLGPDTTVCKGEVVVWKASGDYTSWLWSDYSTDSFFTTSTAGIHFVEVTDACGRTGRDSVRLSHTAPISLDLGPDQFICAGDTVRLAIGSTIDRVYWFPSALFVCDTCETTEATVAQDTWLIVVVERAGCIHTDSVRIEIADHITVVDSMQLCQGDTLLLGGQLITTAGRYADTMTDCDTLRYYQVNMLDTNLIRWTESICTGDSFYFDDRWIHTPGQYQQTHTGSNGCDSLITLDLSVRVPVDENIRQEICQGDSAWINGDWYHRDTTLTIRLTDRYGCDSITRIQLVTTGEIVTSEDLQLCVGDSLFVFGHWFGIDTTLSEHYQTLAGCDSVHFVSLTVTTYRDSLVEYRICTGDTVRIAGLVLTTTTQLMDTLPTSFCSVIIHYDIAFSDSILTYEYLELCPGDSVWIDGSWVTDSGLWQSHHVSTSGCDSIHVIEIETTLSDPSISVDTDCLAGIHRLTVDASTDWHILWSTGDTTEILETSGGLTIDVTLINDDGCLFYEQFDLPLIPGMDAIPMIDDTLLHSPGILRLDLQLDTNYRVMWSPSEVVTCPTCIETDIHVDRPLAIEMTIDHLPSGCQYVTSFFIDLEDDQTDRLYIPNAFSPNDDGINDRWQLFPSNDSIKVISAAVYDRWGNQLRNWTQQERVSWNGMADGKPLMPGVYVYSILWEDSTGERHRASGDIVLLR